MKRLETVEVLKLLAISSLRYFKRIRKVTEGPKLILLKWLFRDLFKKTCKSFGCC